METTEFSQRIRLIYNKFDEYVVLHRRPVKATWERFGEYIAIRAGWGAVSTKAKVSRWKGGGGIDATDALAVADIFGVDLRWLIAGEGEMGVPSFGELPESWGDEAVEVKKKTRKAKGDKKAPDGA